MGSVSKRLPGRGAPLPHDHRQEGLTPTVRGGPGAVPPLESGSGGPGPPHAPRPSRAGIGLVLAMLAVVIGPLSGWILYLGNQVSDLQKSVDTLKADERLLHDLANFKAAEVFGEACGKAKGQFIPGLGCQINGTIATTFTPPYPIP